MYSRQWIPGHMPWMWTVEGRGGVSEGSIAPFNRKNQPHDKLHFLLFMSKVMWRFIALEVGGLTLNEVAAEKFYSGEPLLN